MSKNWNSAATMWSLHFLMALGWNLGQKVAEWPVFCTEVRSNPF